MLRFHITVHQEALPVFGHVVSKNVRRRNRSAAVNLEQRRRRSGGENRFAVDLHRHQHAAGCNIENFLAVSAPAWLGAAAARHLPFSRRAGKRRDVNLPDAGFVGGIGHPLSVRRYLTVGLAALAGQKPVWSSPGNGYQLKILPRRNLAREKDLIPVAGGEPN